MSLRPYRGYLVAAGVVLAVLAALAIAGWLAGRSQYARDWLQARLKAEVRQAIGAELELGALEGNLLYQARVRQVRLVLQGRELFSAQEVEVTYNPLALLGGSLRLESLRLLRPRLAPGLLGLAGTGGNDSTPLSVDTLEVEEGFLEAGGRLGPLRSLQGVDIRGELRRDSRGLWADGQVSIRQLAIQGLEQPLSVQGRLRLTERSISLAGMSLTLGPNSLVISGRYRWAPKPSLQAQLSARGLQVTALPLAWPGPQPPRAPLDLLLELRGSLEQSQVKAEISLAASRLKLQGQVNLVQPGGRLEGTLRDCDLQDWGLSNQPVLMDGRLVLSGQGLPGRAQSSLEVELDLSRLQAMGVQARQARAQAKLQGSKLEVSQLSARDDWGALRARGQVDLSQAKPLMQGQVRLERLRAPAELIPGLAGMSLNGLCQFKGTPDELALQLELGPSQLAADLELKSLSASGGLSQGRWWLRALRLESAGFSLDAKGQADAQRVALDFSGQVRELAQVEQALVAWRLMPSLGLAGSGTVQGRLSGPWSAPTLKAQASLRQISLPLLTAGQVQVSVDLSRLLPRPQGRLVLKARGLSALQETWSRAEIVVQTADGQGQLGLRAHSPEYRLGLALSFSQPGDWPLKASLQELVYQQADLGTWRQQGQARFSLEPGSLQVEDLVLGQEGQTVWLEGDLTPQGQISGQLKVQGLKLGPLFGQNRHLAKATLDGQATLSGRVENPSLAVKGVVANISLAGLADSRLELQGSLADRSLRFKGQVRGAGMTLMDLEGRLGMEVQLLPPDYTLTPEGLQARLQSRAIPLALFQPLLGNDVKLEGQMEADLALSGALLQPRLNGELRVAGGRLNFPATGQDFKDLKVHLRAQGRDIIVEQFTANSGGPLSLSGRLRLPGPDSGGVDLRLTAQDVEVSLGPFGQVTTDGHLRVQGPLAHPRLDGALIPDKAALRLGLDSPASLDEVVLLEPGVKPPPLGRRPKVINPAGPLGPMSWQVLVDLTKGLRVKVNEGWVRTKGQLTIKKDPYGPLTFHDRLDLQDGRLLLEGHAFKIKGGGVAFGGKDHLDPELQDVQAQLEGGQGMVQVQVVVSGPASKPKLQLTSVPPMSQADILSTIFFGQPARSLNQGQYEALSSQALALLGMQGRRELERLVGRQLTPDVVTVGEDYSTGSFLEAGKYLSDRLYLRYRRSTKAEGGQNLGVEYQFSPHFSVESQIGDSRDSGVDLTVNFDF